MTIELRSGQASFDRENRAVGAFKVECTAGRRDFCRLMLGAAAITALYGRSFPAWSQGNETDGFGKAWLIGEPSWRIARQEDTLGEIARESDLGFTELMAANPGVDPWLPPPGTRVLLPGAHLLPDVGMPGILINLSQQRLFVMPQGEHTIRSFPIGIGQAGWETPTGVTRIVGKRENPTWTVPLSLRQENPALPAQIPPGPNNPLGTHALELAWPGYGIHGTNKPYGVGRRISHGCIRLYPEDIADLFEMVDVGTPVTIVDLPIVVGWVKNALYLEAHPSLDQADEIAAFGYVIDGTDHETIDDLKTTAGSRRTDINWWLVSRIVKARRSVPVVILDG